MDVAHGLLNSHGNIFTMWLQLEILQTTKIDITTSGHEIFNIDGERFDESEKDRIIVNNVEPWQPKIIFESRNKEIDVKELRIGEREFVLKVSIPSTKCPTPKTMTIQCQITLISIRHPIMKYLIKSFQESLIKHILNKKINSKNSNIYIPRLYKWEYENNDRSTTEISKSDLYYAILCIQERGDPTVILKYLIDYYAGNDKEYNNHGWMFTVSKAIPLLYDHNLKNLFTRFRTSRDDRNVYMVPLPDFTVYPNPKDSYPNLKDPVPKDLKDNSENYSKYFWFLFALFRTFLWPSRKVITNTREMSHFLRVIHEEKNQLYYQIFASLYIFTLDGSLLLPLANIVGIFNDYQVFVLQNSVYYSVLAFTVLVMWLQLLFLSRYFEGPGRFIYIIQSILKTISPLLAVMFIVILAFDHAMFILLNHVNDLQIPTYKIKDTSNSDLYSNITIYQDIGKSSRLDNYYSNFVSSVEAVFFWTNGRWDQLNQWNSYAVDVISILGGIVFIFQNMLIAFMNDAFDNVNRKSHTAAQRYRVELIAEYEAVENPFHDKRGNPRYIYYIPDPNVIDTRLTETRSVENQKLRLVGENSAELLDFEDSDDDDNQDNSSYLKKYRPIHNESFSNTINLDSIRPRTIDGILFIGEEIFMLKDVNSKLNKKSNDKPLKNVIHTLYRVILYFSFGDFQHFFQSIYLAQNLKYINDMINDDDDNQDNSSYLKKYRPIHNESFSNTINLDSIRPRTIDGILFIGEEIFMLKDVNSKLNKKSNDKPLKNVIHTLYRVILYFSFGDFQHFFQSIYLAQNLKYINDMIKYFRVEIPMNYV
ncbi:hypothetical protein Glove_139g243 [Diversispora epigaea]|uniref:Ion transport domain-containing protein n=1 Tax=Diversispora epigaea TaxID=1348612 RepID=A0A397IY60_9GLOM|nr:hypothetical protein Glove_139g243 [Diversispora epigaea]